MSTFGVSMLVPAALVAHALAVAASLASARRAAWCRRMAFGGSALASALTTSAAVVVLTSGQPLAGVLFTHSASALVVDYVVTPLSAWFLLLLGVVAIPVAIYSIGYRLDLLHEQPLAWAMPDYGSAASAQLPLHARGLPQEQPPGYLLHLWPGEF